MQVHILYQEDNQTADYQSFISNFKVSIRSFKLDCDFKALGLDPTMALNIAPTDLIVFLTFEIEDPSYNLKLLANYAQGISRDNIFVVEVSSQTSDLYKNYKYYTFLDSQNREYWTTLLGLLYDLKAYIKNQERNRPAIYLASVPSNMAATRNSIKWELQQHGYRILPEANLSLVAHNGLTALVQQNIAKAILAIHFFSEQYDEPIPELRASIPELEYDITEDFGLKNPNFKSFVWLSVSSDEVNNINQKNLIQKIETISYTSNTQIIKGNTKEFNLVLHRYLDSIYQVPVEKQLPKVYCIFDGIDKTKFENALLQSTSQNTVFSYKLSGQVFGEHVNRQEHQDYLKQVKTCLLFLDQASQEWLYTNIQNIIKAMGIGRETKWENIHIVYPSSQDGKIEGLKDRYPHYYSLLKLIELENFDSGTFANLC